MENEIEIIRSYLLLAGEHGLETEVVATALLYMKDDPSLSVAQAMTSGYFEWVK